MNRRAMVILPGIALGASRAFAETGRPTDALAAGGRISHKAAARYSSLKSFYKIPKNETKQAKYIKFLSAALALTPNQQTQAANIFATAGASHAEVKVSVKAARQTLGAAVKNNDSAGIGKASAVIGSLAAQHHLLGASAQAAFFQILTSDQQAKLNQFRS